MNDWDDFDDQPAAPWRAEGAYPGGWPPMDWHHDDRQPAYRPSGGGPGPAYQPPDGRTQTYERPHRRPGSGPFPAYLLPNGGGIAQGYPLISDRPAPVYPPSDDWAALFTRAIGSLPANETRQPPSPGRLPALEQLPGHHHALDLVGALVDLGDRGSAGSFRW
jgi:hypothetical protein